MPDSPLSNLHPSLSVFMLELLNEWSNALQIERAYDEESGEFYVAIKTRFSEWMKGVDGQSMFVSDAVVTAWRCDDRKQMDELIELLVKVRDQVWPDDAGTVNASAGK